MLSFLLLAVLLVGVHCVPKKVLFIVLDGARVDCLKQLHLPYIDSIVERGGYVDFDNHRSEYPYCSTVNYASMLLGVNQSHHGIIESTFISRGNIDRFPSIVGVLKTHGDLVRASNGPVLKTAMFHVWDDLATYLVPDADILVSAPSDDLMTARAEVALRIDLDLDLVLVIYDDIDFVGHHLGGFACNSDPYTDRILETDTMVGRLLDALDNRTSERAHLGDLTPEDWLVIVTNDHGGHFVDHSGASVFERDRFVVSTHPLPASLSRHFDGVNVKDGRTFNPTFVSHFALSHFGIAEDDLPKEMKEGYFWDNPHNPQYTWWLGQPIGILDTIDLLVTIFIPVAVSLLIFAIFFCPCLWTCRGQMDAVPQWRSPRKKAPKPEPAPPDVVIPGSLSDDDESLPDEEEQERRLNIFEELRQIYPYDELSTDASLDVRRAMKDGEIHTIGDFYRAFPDLAPEGYAEARDLAMAEPEITSGPKPVSKGPYIADQEDHETPEDITRYYKRYKRKFARRGRRREERRNLKRYEIDWKADN